ncbi:MAG: HlyD family efflux transporter periplasmic adaptor subunit [Bacteroidetes bacterium]|nr:HlyD family efflux transporter periplasmic adaptor subunit [Bacteroidota bacterium]
MNSDKSQNTKRIELRSEEIEEILGRPPRRLLRIGITLIFIVIVAILTSSWFFKYPDFITASVEVTSENPPAFLAARVNGKIEKLLVTDEQPVSSGDVLIIIENPANYQDVFQLKQSLGKFRDFLNGFHTAVIDTSMFHKDYILGGIQTYYGVLVTKYEEYMHFLRLDYYTKKIQSLRQELSMHNMYYERQYRQKVILEEDFALMEKEYNRYLRLYDSAAVSVSVLEKVRSDYLGKQLAFEEARTNLANIKINISRLEQNILDQQLQQEQKRSELQLAVKEAYETLTGEIDVWEKDYILKSPIEGIVTFNKYWNENQNVEEGEEVMAVVPAQESRIIGKLELNTRGAGKVRSGQTVNIRFNNYPYMEFGMVKGRIDNMSMVPSDKDFYLVEVSFPEGLITNYGIRLDFSQKMLGQAEIVTDDIPLLVRIIQPLKSLLKNRSFRQIPEKSPDKTVTPHD